MKTYPAAAAIVMYQGNILLCKYVGNAIIPAGKWAPIVTMLDKNEAAEDATYRALKDYVGITPMLTRTGNVFDVLDEKGRFVVMPYLGTVPSEDTKINKKIISEVVWLPVTDIEDFDTAEGIKSYLISVGLL